MRVTLSEDALFYTLYAIRTNAMGLDEEDTENARKAYNEVKQALERQGYINIEDF